MAIYLGDKYQDGVLGGKPWENVQGLYAESSVQHFPVGTIVNLHGRRFRYCRAAEAIPISGRGSPNLAYVPWHTDNAYASKGTYIYAAYAGDKKVTVRMDDYIYDFNSLSKNYFAGGYACVFNDTNTVWTLRIAGNEPSTSYDANNEDMIIYLDDPLPDDLASTTIGFDLYPSPYMNQGAGSSVGTLARVTAIPLITVSSGSWFWGQTLGPCWVTPTAGIVTANVHQVVFHTDGTVKVNSGDGLQLAGYMIMRGDGSADDSLIMLQLE